MRRLLVVLVLVAGCARTQTATPQPPSLTPTQQWCQTAMIAYPDIAVRGWTPASGANMLDEANAPPEIRADVHELRERLRRSSAGTTVAGGLPPAWSADTLERAVRLDEWVLANCHPDPAVPTVIEPCRAMPEPFPPCPRIPTTATR